jgi:hypothetical protein
MTCIREPEGWIEVLYQLYLFPRALRKRSCNTERLFLPVDTYVLQAVSSAREALALGRDHATTFVCTWT